MEFIYEGKSLKSGIYKITNTQNGRTYYGSAKEFKERWKQHKHSLEKGKHQNKFLQADFLKCGTEVFVFEVLEVVEGTKEERLLVEEKYLKQHFDNGKLCYNLCDRAISREGRRSKSPEETAKKCSATQKRLWQDPEERKKRIEGKDGQRRKNIGEAAKMVWASMTPEAKRAYVERSLLTKRGWPKGSKHTAETKAFMKKINKEKCRPGTAEHKRLVEFNKNRVKTVEVLSPSGDKIVITNVSKFCRDHKLHKRSMLELTNKKRLVYKGWKLR